MSPQYYLKFEVIECAWHELDARLSNASDLDDILTAVSVAFRMVTVHGRYCTDWRSACADARPQHREFLGAIEQKSMLRLEDEELHRALRALFDTILQFARNQDVLYMSLLEQKAAAKQHAAAVTASAAAGRWAAIGPVSDVQHGVVMVEQRLKDQLVNSAAEYRNRFRDFFTLLRQHASDNTAFLAFRLDFNVRAPLRALLKLRRRHVLRVLLS